MARTRDEWILTADGPAAGPLYLANGYLGSSLDAWGGVLLHSDAAPTYLRGVYDASTKDGIDRLVELPSWTALQYDAPAEIIEYRRDLDLRRAVLRTELLLEEERGRLRLVQTAFLSRADRHTAVVRLELEPEFSGELGIRAPLAARPGRAFEVTETGGDGSTVWLRGTTATYGVEVATCRTFLDEGWTVTDDDGATQRLRRVAAAGDHLTLTQITRFATSLEHEHPLAVAFAPAGTWTALREAHEAAWADLWQTDIEIEGDAEAQQWVRAALFYLWSSVAEGDHWSIAPMGLSGNGYNGHIFWDAELWSFPPLLVTHPTLAQSCVAYRERTIEAARERARDGGFDGAQYPWEGAFSGAEMTPRWADTRDLQIHITADVAIAQWWYYVNTGNKAWLGEHGWPVIRACAEFWATRVERHGDRYELSNVVCADEYAAHVDNDAFTNAAVRKALLIAIEAATVLGEEAPDRWHETAERIHIPYNRQARRHQEFDGYDGRATKQADVELLAYPLEYVTDRGAVARDLDFYARVIDPEGPAMSFSVYAVVSAQLGRAEAAYGYFLRSFEPNTRGPFEAFSETPTNNQFLYCTGIGGALQALLFGFTGLRLRRGAVLLKPILPAHWSALRLRNLCLAGERRDIEITPGQVTVRGVGDTLTAPWPDDDDWLLLDQSGLHSISEPERPVL